MHQQIYSYINVETVSRTFIANAIMTKMEVSNLLNTNINDFQNEKPKKKKRKKQNYDAHEPHVDLYTLFWCLSMYIMNGIKSQSFIIISPCL